MLWDYMYACCKMYYIYFKLLRGVYIRSLFCCRDVLLKPLLFVVFFCLVACFSNLCDLSLAV